MIAKITLKRKHRKILSDNKCGYTFIKASNIYFDHKEQYNNICKINKR